MDAIRNFLLTGNVKDYDEVMPHLRVEIVAQSS